MTAVFGFLCLQIQYWETDVGAVSMKEHVIIHREPWPCWREHHPHVGRVRRDISSGHVYNLRPYTNYTAQILVLNAKYEGKPSTHITFTTAEGGRLRMNGSSTGKSLNLGVI